MNRLLFGMILLAVGCLAGSCTDDDEYTQGVWMRRSDLDGVARGQASSFTIGNKGYLCCGYRGSNKTYLKDLWEYKMVTIGRNVPICPMRHRDVIVRLRLP